MTLFASQALARQAAPLLLYLSLRRIPFTRRRGEADAGSWGAGLTPLSHVSYWTENSLMEPVDEFLGTLLGMAAP